MSESPLRCDTRSLPHQTSLDQTNDDLLRLAHAIHAVRAALPLGDPRRAVLQRTSAILVEAIVQ